MSAVPSAPKTPSTGGYYPHIDGLRGISVLVILLFHLDVPYFSGGFIGVDIFYVISGYLITSLVLEEIRRDRFTFARFYTRRVRRLLPALLFTLLVTGLWGALVLPPHRLEELGSSSLAALASVSNIYFWSQSGYFDTAAVVKPLLHTWSLSVEEQFYLFWPSLLLLLARTRWTVIAVLLLGIASFVAAQIWLTRDPSAAFFLTPFRIGELALGGVLYWSRNEREPGEGIKLAVSVIALGVIAYCVLTYSQATPFPGLTALYPCLAAALLIRFGDCRRCRVLLNNSPLVWLGLISYSLYLIHWPLIVLFKYSAGPDLTLASGALLFIASLAAATFMYVFVETPFRQRASGGYRVPARAFFALLGVGATAIVSLSAYASLTRGALWRNGAPQTLTSESIAAAKNARFKVLNRICHKRGRDRCEDPGTARPSILVLGDSHAPDALNALATVFPEGQLTLRSLPGCPPLDPEDFGLLLPGHPDRTKCLDYNRQNWASFPFDRYDLIVVNLMFDWYGPQALIRSLDRLRERTKAPILVLGNYIVLHRDFPDLVAQHPDRPLTEGSVKSLGLYDTDLERAATGRFVFLSKRRLLCAGEGIESCPLWFDGEPFTYDEHHLSLAAARVLGERLRREPALSAMLGASAQPLLLGKDR